MENRWLKSYMYNFIPSSIFLFDHFTNSNTLKFNNIVSFYHFFNNYFQHFLSRLFIASTLTTQLIHFQMFLHGDIHDLLVFFSLYWPNSISTTLYQHWQQSDGPTTTCQCWQKHCWVKVHPTALYTNGKNLSWANFGGTT